MKEKMFYKKLQLIAFVTFAFAIVSFSSISAQSSENLLLTTGKGTVEGNVITGIKDGTPVSDLVDGLTVSDSATYIVADKDKNEITDGSTVLTEDMMVIVTAENGDENIYTIEIVPLYDIMIEAQKAETAPVIDSYFDDWEGYDENPIDSIFTKENKGILPPDSEDDLSAFYKVAWDDDNLYLFVDITDDILFSDPEANEWLVDGIEISILLSDAYDYRDAFDIINFPNPISQKYIVRYNSTEWAGNNIEEEVRDKFGRKMEQYVKDDGNGNTIGWQVEMSFSWNTLKGFEDSSSFEAAVDEKISIAFAVNDNDGNGRESVLRWATLANMNKGGADFGVIKLAGLNISIEKNNLIGLNVFPNPVSDILTIDNNEKIKLVQIYNIRGQEVKSIPVQKSNKNISVADLNSGVYILKVIDNNGASAIQKIVKK